MIDSLPFRPLTADERRLINRLLEENFPGRETIAMQAANCQARELDAHGCLEFKVEIDVEAETKFRVPTEGEAEDVDGVTVHVLLHIINGKLNELEIYKDDGSEILQMPEPDTLDFSIQLKTSTPCNVAASLHQL